MIDYLYNGGIIVVDAGDIPEEWQGYFYSEEQSELARKIASFMPQK